MSCDGSRIVKQRQLAIRREMDRRGILLKIVSQDSGIPYPTLATYFPADPCADPSQIPGGAIYALADTKALPADLLSDLMPNGWAIVRVPEGIDLDEIDAMCRDLADTKAAYHHPDSEAGRDLGPTETADLCAKVVRLRA
jgi:hypothetical protein